MALPAPNVAGDTGREEKWRVSPIRRYRSQSPVLTVIARGHRLDRHPQWSKSRRTCHVVSQVRPWRSHRLEGAGQRRTNRNAVPAAWIVNCVESRARGVARAGLGRLTARAFESTRQRGTNLIKGGCPCINHRPTKRPAAETFIRPCAAEHTPNVQKKTSAAAPQRRDYQTLWV